jgi:hypothetical protein
VESVKFSENEKEGEVSTLTLAVSTVSYMSLLNFLVTLKYLIPDIWSYIK